MPTSVSLFGISTTDSKFSGDGISRTELADSLAELKIELSQSQVDRLYRMLDLDANGSITSLEAERAIPFYIGLMLKQQDRSGSAMQMNAADIDGAWSAGSKFLDFRFMGFSPLEMLMSSSKNVGHAEGSSSDFFSLTLDEFREFLVSKGLDERLKSTKFGGVTLSVNDSSKLLFERLSSGENITFDSLLLVFEKMETASQGQKALDGVMTPGFDVTDSSENALGFDSLCAWVGQGIWRDYIKGELRKGMDRYNEYIRDLKEILEKN